MIVTFAMLESLVAKQLTGRLYLENDTTGEAPYPYAVMLEVGSEDERDCDIVGAGNTEAQAVEDAVRQFNTWGGEFLIGTCPRCEQLMHIGDELPEERCCDACAVQS